MEEGAAVAAPPATNGSTDASVYELKRILEDPASSESQLQNALDVLRGMGDIPRKVLSDTMIGKTVNLISKSHAVESVQENARKLVEGWKMTHGNKRKGGPDTPRRTLSNLSMGEASTLSGPELSLTQSQDDVKPSSQDLQSAEPPKRSTTREKVVKTLAEALGKFEKVEDMNTRETGGGDGAQQDAKDAGILADEIETALFTQLGEDTQKRYMPQARAVIHNLKDKSNPTFIFKLMVGMYEPTQVPNLTAEDMASDDRNEERRKLRKYAMEEIQTDWALKNGQQRISGMFTCGKCKGTRTTYFQMQTRSSDEPMTTFVSCLTCNNRWKFC